MGGLQEPCLSPGQAGLQSLCEDPVGVLWLRFLTAEATDSKGGQRLPLQTSLFAQTLKPRPPFARRATTGISQSEIATTVPAGATGGFVTVATPTGTLKSNVRFQVTP
jgi:hypothetical protein